MKILPFHEFVKLPKGTLYSEVGFGGLMRLGELIPDRGTGDAIDFIELIIVPPMPTDEDLDEPDSEGPWGAFDGNARFCVYEPGEVQEMAALLNLEARRLNPPTKMPPGGCCQAASVS